MSINPKVVSSNLMFSNLASVAGTSTICPVILPTKAGSEELLGVAIIERGYQFCM
jgi:hypothetical protein